MAGDWVAMRLDLAEDEAVIHVAEKLGIEPDLVVGKLHRLWSWANRQLTDGVSRVSPAWVDRHVSAAGFAAALAETEWLQIRSTGVVFPKFEQWNSTSAKKRLLDSRRKHQKRQSAGPPRKVRTLSASQADKNGTTEQESTEEKKHPPDPPAGGECGPDLTKRRVSLEHALILPPIVTHALQAYTPETQQRAWSVLQDFLAYCPGNRSTGTQAKMATAFADALLAHPEAEGRLRDYLAVRDPRQIEQQFTAGTRLRPQASPWEICDFLFPPPPRETAPAVPKDDGVLAREKARLAKAQANPVTPEQFAAMRKQRAAS